jgi:hypothetical protein
LNSPAQKKSPAREGGAELGKKLNSASMRPAPRTVNQAFPAGERLYNARARAGSSRLAGRLEYFVKRICKQKHLHGFAIFRKRESNPLILKVTTKPYPKYLRATPSDQLSIEISEIRVERDGLKINLFEIFGSGLGLSDSGSTKAKEETGRVAHHID